jgi:hypothetical protein
MLRSSLAGGITMTRNSRFAPYDKPTAGAFDDDASDPDFMAYRSARSTATEDYSMPEDRMPLFLSDEPEEPKQRGFGTGGEIYRTRPATWPRIFKAGIFAASAATIGFAVLTVGNPLALFADAKASLPETSAAQSSAAPPTPAVQSATVRPAAPAASPAPTRDEIAAALRTARQIQPETFQPPAAAQPPAAVPPPARRLDAAELATLMKRARSLIAVGDIAPARLLLERAADAQEASAALLLAQTYDPAVLGTQDMRSITPDPAKARDWYQKAAQLGSLDARERLARIQN